MKSTKLTLKNALPPGFAKVTFNISEQTGSSKVTVPAGGSVQYPTLAAEGPWLVSATVAANGSNAPSNTTAAQTVKNASATISLTVGQIIGELDFGTPALALSGDESSCNSSEDPDTGISILDRSSSWDASVAVDENLQAAGALNMVMDHQTQTQWCWAALASSVAKFYNDPSTYTQCGLANTAFTQTTCCVNGSSSACNKPYGMASGLKLVKHWKATYARAFSMSEIAAEIDVKHPLAVAVLWSSGSGGHGMAIDGYDTVSGKISIKDPWYGSTVMTLSTFPASYQSGGSWAETDTTQ